MERLRAALEFFSPARADCLCLFDVDRVLTGRQVWTEGRPCPQNRRYARLLDTAYGGGMLSTSALFEGLNKTFCGRCYAGVLSAGSVIDFKPFLLHRLRSLSLGRALPADVGAAWANWTVAAHPQGRHAPLLTGVPFGIKHIGATVVAAWYRKHRSVSISRHNVFFFDDSESNVRAFAGSGYNAAQVWAGCSALRNGVGFAGVGKRRLGKHLREHCVRFVRSFAGIDTAASHPPPTGLLRFSRKVSGRSSRCWILRRHARGDCAGTRNQTVLNASNSAAGLAAKHHASWSLPLRASAVRRTESRGARFCVLTHERLTLRQ